MVVVVNQEELEDTIGYFSFAHIQNIFLIIFFLNLIKVKSPILVGMVGMDSYAATRVMTSDFWASMWCRKRVVLTTATKFQLLTFLAVGWFLSSLLCVFVSLSGVWQ